MSARVRVARPTVRVRAYPLFAELVENVAALVARRCFKHADHPTEEIIREVAEREFSNAFAEFFDWGGEDDPR